MLHNWPVLIPAISGWGSPRIPNPPEHHPKHTQNAWNSPPPQILYFPLQNTESRIHTDNWLTGVDELGDVGLRGEKQEDVVERYGTDKV